MTTLSLVMPQIGQPDTTEDVKLINALTAIQSAINGNIDTTNLTAAVSQSAGINASGQTVKGSSIIAASQGTSSTTFTTLSTPDQVTGIVLPANGLIQVWYQATWVETVGGASQAAIFLGANQLQAANDGPTGSTRGVQSVSPGAGATISTVLTTFPLGLISLPGGATYAGDVTTGQVFGGAIGAGTSTSAGFTISASTYNIPGTQLLLAGGPCHIFAAAGTYTISVQFKTSSGTVTAGSRRLYVQAISFA